MSVEYGSDEAREQNAEWQAGASDRAETLNRLGKEAGREGDIAETPETDEPASEETASTNA